MTPEEIARLPYRPCVGVMLMNNRGEVFVGQRLDTRADAWQMPQGGVDDGEDPRNAALRELWEETGISSGLVDIVGETEDWLTYDLPLEIVPKLWKARYRGQKQKWFLMLFNGSDEDINIETAHPEFSKWRWLPATELVENIVPFKKHVYVAVLDAFEAHF